jgi:hypothetical protein
MTFVVAILFLVSHEREKRTATVTRLDPAELVWIPDPGPAARGGGPPPKPATPRPTPTPAVIVPEPPMPVVVEEPPTASRF